MTPLRIVDPAHLSPVRATLRAQVDAFIFERALARVAEAHNAAALADLRASETCPQTVAFPSFDPGALVRTPRGFAVVTHAGPNRAARRAGSRRRRW